MATYQYKCESCGEVEVDKPMAESSRVEFCPECSAQMDRVFTVPQWNIPGIEFSKMSNFDMWGHMENKRHLEKEAREMKAKGIEPESVKVPIGLPEVCKPNLK